MIPNILSIIILLPLVSAFVILFIPENKKEFYHYIATASSFLTLVLAGLLIVDFDFSASSVQFIENVDWIPLFDIHYLVGVDGLSIPFLILTALFFLLGILFSWSKSNFSKSFFVLLLMLETSILGTFCAQDLFLFFTFWVSSIPIAYFMINFWGNENREYVASRFFMHHFIGSGLFLLGMLAVYNLASPHSFNLMDLSGGKLSSTMLNWGGHSYHFEHIAFVLMLLGLATRIPLVPFHSWLPQVQTETPIVISVIIASVFLKTGTYALLRINDSLFPGAARWSAFVIGVLGVVNIIYGALCALGQKDIRRFVAYSCVSQMGVILLGLSIFSTSAFHGAFLEMVAHSIFAGMLFFMIGILGIKAGHYCITKEDGSCGYGGLFRQLPVFTGFFTVALMAAIGIPGLGVFHSQILIFLGAFSHQLTLMIAALAGILILIGSFLWMYKQVFLGSAAERSQGMPDLSLREKLLFSPLIVLSVLVGAYPAPVLDLARSSLQQVLTILGK